MKLAIIRTAVSPLNLESYNCQEIGLAKALLKKDVSVDIYSQFKFDEAMVLEENDKGNTLNLVPIKPFFSFKLICLYKGVCALIKAGNYDIIQFHEDSQVMTPVILWKLRKHRVGKVLYQGMYKNFKGVKSIFQLLVNISNRLITRKCIDFCFAKTPDAENYLLSKGFKNIFVLPVGLNFPKEQNNDELYNKLARFLSNKSKTLSYVGVLESRRNVSFILVLLKKLLFKNPSIGLVIVGKGPELGLIRKNIERSKLDENVLLIESISNSELWYLYEETDLFLLPTKYEIYGMVLLEAIYYGCPVIATPEAGPKSIVKNAKLGALVPLDEISWMDKINCYLSNRCKTYSRSKMKGYIYNNFNWDTIAATYVNKVSDLIYPTK